MTKWKKILLLIAGIALVTIACFISWSYGFKQGLSTGGLTSSTAEYMLSDKHIADQVNNASCEGVKQAINDHLQLLERYKDVKGSFISGTTYFGDKMMTHVRLAQIEKHMGNSIEAQKHLDMARQVCTQRQWKDCSEEKLAWFGRKLDEKSPIACLGNHR